MADLLTPMVVRVAATLRLADVLGSNRRSALELAALTDSDPDAFCALARHLHAIGVLRLSEHGDYELTSLGEQLRSDHPNSILPWLDSHDPLGKAELTLASLLDTISRAGNGSYHAVHGHTLWEELLHSPADARKFDSLMGQGEFELAAEKIAGSYDWGVATHLVDVGGGTGGTLLSILRAYPALRATLLDLPEPAAAARAHFASAGLTGPGFHIIEGSFFDPLPKGGDIYLLARVLADWDSVSCAAILRRCKEAMAPTARVVVVDQTIDDLVDDNLPTSKSGVGLRVLSFFGKVGRTIDDYSAIARTAGLRPGSLTRLGRYFFLTEFLPE